MRKLAVNYMKGELKQMPKKAVADIYYNLLRENGKQVLRKDLDGYSKDQLIYQYGKLRNKIMLS